MGRFELDNWLWSQGELISRGPNGGVVMAARTRYAPDRGLTVRMTATMFLLGLVFVAFVAAIIGIGTAYGASSSAIVLFAVVLGGGFAIGSLFFSDKIALATAGAAAAATTRAPCRSCSSSWPSARSSTRSASC